VRLHFCGVRGSTPAPGAEFVRYGGNTSCVAVAHDNGAPPTLILDAGTGIRRVTALLAGQPFTGTILLTHLHWDHVQGLPFFRAGDREDATVRLLLPDQQDGTSAEAVLSWWPPRKRRLRCEALNRLSASRTRCTIISSRAQAVSGCSMAKGRKTHAVNIRQRNSVSAVIFAERNE
jgi:ribonuclease BN (tRNA processing enzyme)